MAMSEACLLNLMAVQSSPTLNVNELITKKASESIINRSIDEVEKFDVIIRMVLGQVFFGSFSRSLPWR